MVKQLSKEKLWKALSGPVSGTCSTCKHDKVGFCYNAIGECKEFDKWEWDGIKDE